MRIAVIADSLSLGGLETHVVTFTNELLERGHHILIYANYMAVEMQEQIIEGNGTFKFQPWTDNPVGDVLSFQPDLVHAHPFTAMYLGYEIATALDLPLIVTIHGMYDFGVDRSPGGNQISGYAYRIITVDDGVRQLVMNCTAHPEKVSVIRNGIDLRQFHPEPIQPHKRVELGLVPEWFTLVSVGRLDDGKQLPVLQLLHCAPQLADKLNGFNVVVVGTGSWLDQVRTKAEEISGGTAKLKIAFTGNQKDVTPYISMADLVMACDRSALEAMACRRTVLAANASGFAGLITPDIFHQTMFYRGGYRPLVDQELVDIIAGVAGDTTLRNSLPFIMSLMVYRYFDINKCVTELERLYKLARKGDEDACSIES